MDYKTKFFNDFSESWKNVKCDWKKEVLAALESQNRTIDFNSETKKIEGIPNTFGIYLFQIKPKQDISWKEFEKLWKLDQKNLVKTPQLIIDKNKHNKAGEWHPLYIGKSEKLIDRISEHCYQGADKTTYSLKLSHRKSLLSNAEISYNYYSVGTEKEYNKAVLQFVITNLESEIRKEIKPWIGKQ
jgi:translation elongation factor EF-G